MQSKYSAAILLSAALLTLGAGCDALMGQQQPAPVAPTPVAQQPASAPTPDQPDAMVPATSTDPYDGWGTITPGGVVSLRIPPGCTSDAAAGSIYVACPTPGNDTPPPDMQVSSDGIQVNIKRWEKQDWDQWDKVVDSLKVMEPLDHDIQINVQK